MIFINAQNFSSALSFVYLSLNFAGGYREVEIPSPIPNLEVKHFIADNTAGSPGGNVGRCQLLSFFQSFFLFELLYLVLLEESFFFTHFLFIYSFYHFSWAYLLFSPFSLPSFFFLYLMFYLTIFAIIPLYF